MRVRTDYLPSVEQSLLMFRKSIVAVFFALACMSAHAQTPVGTLEGLITDPSAAVVAGANVSVSNPQTGLARSLNTSRDGAFHFSDLPAGEYTLSVTANGFAPFSASSIRLDIGQAVVYPVKLELAGSHAQVTVDAQGVLIDTSQTIGNTVLAGEAEDLPLNGRDITQLGLLQPGVAPLPPGLSTAGGIARAGQAFAVNGNAPESNNYLLDGATNVDSVNGGYAIRIPVDAVAEFRILTLNAPAEYGQTSGATTSVVTKSGTNRIHGDVYEFFRNNYLDARNFFSRPPPIPCIAISTAQRWAGLFARTRIFSSSTTKVSARPRARLKAALFPPQASTRVTLRVSRRLSTNSAASSFRTT